MELSLLSQTGFLFLFRWLHIFFGVTWIGLLYYFNFVQGAFFAETDAATKSGATQKLVPRALWWFRWAAMWTFASGWIYLMYRGHNEGASLFATSWGTWIITGALFGTIMWFNVWFVIWPNQKIVIANAVDTAAGKPANPAAAVAGARALVASRTNTFLSMPMLFCMAGASHLPLGINPEKIGTYFIVIAILLAAIEFNALKGKTGPLTTIKGVIHSSVGLTVVVYLIAEFLLK